MKTRKIQLPSFKSFLEGKGINESEGSENVANVIDTCLSDYVKDNKPDGFQSESEQTLTFKYSLDKTKIENNAYALEDIKSKVEDALYNAFGNDFEMTEFVSNDGHNITIEVTCNNGSLGSL